MQQFDLIIVGGGLAGASLAVALRESRLRIALVEKGLVSVLRELHDELDAAVLDAYG